MRLCEYDYYEQETHLSMGAASQYCLRWNNHQTNLVSAFDSLLRQQAFTDVSLACEEGVTLHAHRLVLAACSSYFANLLSSTPHTQHPIVVLKDVRATEMRALLYYMYRGEVNVEQSQLKELLKVAEGLRVKGLVEDLAANTHQTHPLPLITSSSRPVPLLVTPSQRHAREDTRSPPPVDSRVTANGSERWEPDTFYANHFRRPFHSPPQSPYKRPKEEINEDPIQVQIPSPHSYFSPYLPHHANLNAAANRVPQYPLLDTKDHKPLRETYEREKIDSTSRSASSDDLREKRHSPLPVSQHLSPYTVPMPDSPPAKRTRPQSQGHAQSQGQTQAQTQGLSRERLSSPTPILRTALAHTRQFQPDVSSIASLAGSMMPVPPLLSVRSQQSINAAEDLRARTLDAHGDSNEPYNLQMPKKCEPLSDDDSKHFIDITRDEESQDKLGNGPLMSDFSNYHLDTTTPSHFTNFVSYVPTPKPEWKRYKQYTKADLMQSIEAVKKGMTALQASRKYKVPSRTLYDKIKKMGINTIPRRLPSKRPSTTDLEVNDASMMAHRQAPSSLLDGRIAGSEFYPDRPQSRESHEPLQVPNLQIHASLTPDEERRERRSEDFCEGSASQQEEQVVETSARGSFSLVGTKAFPGEDSTPLDLTDTESAIPTRTQIQERA